jgi:prepilin-type N-terminal cleavage/methylation domain-containing protein
MNRLRRALTLVELLVVIAIVGMLIALLLPAVQSARETARRAMCQNHLTQLSLALQLYHQAHEALPAGVRDLAGPIRHEPKGQHYSWLTQILPYVEQGNTYRSINFQAGVYAPINLPVREMGFGVLACASQRSDGPASDYVGCHHNVEAPIDADNLGVLFLNSSVRFDQITDGRSHTLFIGEKLTEEDAQTALPGGVGFMGYDPAMAYAMPGGEAGAAQPPPEEPLSDEPLWAIDP